MISNSNSITNHSPSAQFYSFAEKDAAATDDNSLSRDLEQ